MTSISSNLFINYKLNTNQVSLIDLNRNIEFNLDLQHLKFRITNLTVLSSNQILLTAYDYNSIENTDYLESRYYDYLEDLINLTNLDEMNFEINLIESNLFP